MQTKPYKIVIVDDHYVSAEGMKLLLESRLQINTTKVYTSATEALQKIKKDAPHLLITDYRMPDMNGDDLIKKVFDIYPSLRIIVMSMYDDEYTVKKMMELPVAGYITKGEKPDEIIRGIQQVLMGGTYISPAAAQNYMHKHMLHPPVNDVPVGRNIQDLGSFKFTVQEQAVLKSIGNGSSNKIISDKHFISVNTVAWHKRNIKKKTGLRTTPQLVDFAHRMKLI
jgi:DNA-binding NarL/FixJ family response regulator